MNAAACMAEQAKKNFQAETKNVDGVQRTKIFIVVYLTARRDSKYKMKKPFSLRHEISS